VVPLKTVTDDTQSEEPEQDIKKGTNLHRVSGYSRKVYFPLLRQSRKRGVKPAKTPYDMEARHSFG
jgi:hypothetical protein